MNQVNNNFDLTTSDRIQQLAVDVLTEAELVRTDELTRDLLSTEKVREQAVHTLQEIFGPRPKRPLFYLYTDIRGLPERTRYVVENAGHFIDVLVKYCAHEHGKYRALAMHSSLGSNITRLKKVFPDEFLKSLKLFDGLFYAPAKHEWDVGDRPHLFSVKETVVCLFIARRLADKILDTSFKAREWAKDG